MLLVSHARLYELRSLQPLDQRLLLPTETTSRLFHCSLAQQEKWKVIAGKETNLKDAGSPEQGDVDVTPVIHHALQDKELLPKEHLTDTNYAESKQLVASQLDYGIELIAPTRADNKWQGQAKQGFDASSFQIDWRAHKATCPTGHESSSWTPAIDRRDNEVIKVKFSTKDCQPCSCRSQCTKTDRRTITVRKEEHHMALQKARAREKTPEFWEVYHKRAGIEATLSQGVRAFGMAAVDRKVLRKPTFSSLPVPQQSIVCVS